MGASLALPLVHLLSASPACVSAPLACLSGTGAAHVGRVSSGTSRI